MHTPTRRKQWFVALALCVVGCDKPASSNAAEPAQPSPSDAAPEQPAADAKAGLPDRDPPLARRLVREEGALLLDVRTQEEFDDGHVEGATLIPHTEIEARIAEILEAQGGDKAKPIVVYCGSGRRAGTAKEKLLEQGFENVSNLGGVGDWCEDC